MLPANSHSSSCPMAQDHPLDAVLSVFSTPPKFAELRELPSNTSAKPAENLDICVTPTAKFVTPEHDESNNCYSCYSEKSSPNWESFKEDIEEFQIDPDDCNSVTCVAPKNKEGLEQQSKTKFANDGSAGPQKGDEDIAERTARLLAEQDQDSERRWQASAPTRWDAVAVKIRTRGPSWADADDMPKPGDRCHCCHGGTWWTESAEPAGWRCHTCHPPVRPCMRQVRT